MKVIVFEQWDRLMAKFRAVAKGSADEMSRYSICRVQPKGGVARLSDRAMNQLALAGGRTTVSVPDIVPGKARDFVLRVTAEGENELAFAGAEAFEGDDANALAPPADGETVVYVFTEVAADVFFVTRKAVARIGAE